MTTNKDVIVMMNPTDEQLERGQQAARGLVAHMKRKDAADTSFKFQDGAGEWTVTVDWKSKEGRKPN